LSRISPQRDLNKTDPMGLVLHEMDSKPMPEDYHILYVDKPDDSVWGAIGGGIRNYNRQQAGDDQHQSLCFVLHAPDQEIAGGVIGATYWDWLYLNLLWIKDELRGRGYGQRLLTMAEGEARQRGATFISRYSRNFP
jgi:ribosomal protein S18 acetylase RimI-like enzyme